MPSINFPTHDSMYFCKNENTFEFMHLQRIIIAVIALIGASASFMPWIDIPIFSSKAGTDLCGWLSLSFYCTTLLLSVFLPNIKRQLNNLQLFLVIAPAILSSSAVIWQMLMLREQYHSFLSNPISKVLNFQVEYELGFYLSLSCGIFIAITAALFRVLSKGH
ncbi:MAG: hypothetical protein RL092_140 [Bacteroidota bacterium]